MKLGPNRFNDISGTCGANPVLIAWVFLCKQRYFLPQGWAVCVGADHWGLSVLQQETGAAVRHILNTTVNVRSISFKKKSLYNGLRDQSGTLNVRLSGGLTTSDHTLWHTHHKGRQSVGSQSLRTKLWSLKPGLLDHEGPGSVPAWVCVCECVCGHAFIV